MNKTILTQQQQDLPPKNRAIMIKVILAMTTLLFIIPMLMILISTYYTNKGIMMDAYLMSHEYTQAVTDFYNKNNSCPTENDIKVIITQADTLAHINFNSSSENHTCYIISTLKKLGSAADNKKLILTKTFTQPQQVSEWQCYSDANSWFLPTDCKSHLPTQLKKLID